MLSRRVVDLLIKNGKVSPAQVDEAARMKGFFGGTVESHLLRLGHVEEIALADALTELTGAPYAWAEHLKSIDPGARKRVSAPLLQKHRMCPFKIVDGRLRVAMLDPRDRTGIQQVESATGLTVEPWVTTEYRLHHALERHFGVRFPGVRAIAPTPATAPDHVRVRPSRPLPPPPAGPWARIPDEEPVAIAIDETHPPTRPETTAAPLAATPSREPEPLPTSPATEAAIRVLDEFLSLARDRESIAEAVLTYAARQAARAGLFAVAREGVRGIAGRGRGFETTEVSRVELEPGSGTIFDTALQSRDFYFGVVPALPPNRDLYSALGGRLPAQVLLVPIIVKERTVALLYLDNDDEPMTAPDIATMRRIAAKIGLAFEILLLRTKLRAI